MKKLLLVLVVVLTASCVNIPREAGIKQCSDTPRNAFATLLQGIRDTLFGLIRAVIPDEVSYKNVLIDKNSRSGDEVIQEILKSPVVGGGVNCNCEVKRMVPTSDPQMQEALVERTDVDDDGKLYYSRRTFDVFYTGGNCIHHIVPKTDTWEPS